MGMDDPAVAELMASVAATVSRRAAEVSEDVYEVILREIPELRGEIGRASCRERVLDHV